MFSRNWGNAIRTVKVNRYGFIAMIDRGEMLRRVFDDFRARRVIP